MDRKCCTTTFRDIRAHQHRCQVDQAISSLRCLFSAQSDRLWGYDSCTSACWFLDCCMLWLLLVAFYLTWGCKTLTFKIYATVEQVHIKTKVLNLVNLIHSYLQGIYTIYFLDIVEERKKKLRKKKNCHLQVILPQKHWPIHGLEATDGRLLFPYHCCSFWTSFAKGHLQIC